MKSKKQWNDDLPDTSKWQPREDAQETLARAFLKRCQGIEQKILLLSELERSTKRNYARTMPKTSK